jgi:hypothetical protein
MPVKAVNSLEIIQGLYGVPSLQSTGRFRPLQVKTGAHYSVILVGKCTHIGMHFPTKITLQLRIFREQNSIHYILKKCVCQAKYFSMRQLLKFLSQDKIFQI